MKVIPRKILKNELFSQETNGAENFRFETLKLVLMIKESFIRLLCFLENYIGMNGAQIRLKLQMSVDTSDECIFVK